MNISEHDAMLVLHPELRDPELERRRLDTLARSGWLTELATPENLRGGIPPPLKPRKAPQP